MMDWEVRLRQQYAIAVRPEWLEQVIAQLRAAHPDFSTWPEDHVFERIFTAFLFCDLNQAGAAALPANTKAMHKEVLMGKFVLQLDEVVNMAAAARERYTDQAGGRCLKFALTDGTQQVLGVEHAHLPTLTWDCPAGSKVLIHNVPIRRGLLLLGPDNTALLGGQVERLEAARQRAVAAWTKPVVGRPAGSAERDIFAEARQAAWAPGALAAAPPQAGPSAAAAGSGPQGASAGAQRWGGMAPLQSGAAGGAAGAPGMAVAAPPAQPQHPPAAWQAPAGQQQHQPPAVISGIRGQMLATGDGQGAPAAAAAAPAPAAGPSWQPPAGTSQVHHQHHQQQQQPQQQGWNHYQPNAATQARSPTPLAQAAAAAAPAGAPAGPPWLGRSANAGLGGSSGGGSGPASTDAAVPPPRPGLISRNGGVGVGTGGVGGGRLLGASPGMDLVTSSDSGASADSQSRSSNDQTSQRPSSNPHLSMPQPHHARQHQQLQQELAPAPRLRLPTSISGGGAALLGGSTAMPPPVAAGMGLSTSSSGLLPPRPATAAAAQGAGPSGLPPHAIPAGGTRALAAVTTGGLRKPVLPLARSSPGPSGSLGSIGRGGAPGAASAGAAPSPTTNTASLGGALPGAAAPRRPLFPGPAAGAGSGQGASGRSGRGVCLAVDVEMVDLAALDDDDEEEEDGVEDGWAAPPGTAAGLQRDARQQQRAQGGKAKLQPPLDPAGRTEKRPRLLPEQPGCSGGSDGGGTGPGLGREMRAGRGAAEELVREMQMHVDPDATALAGAEGSGVGVSPAGGSGAGAWVAGRQHPQHDGSAAGPMSRGHEPPVAAVATAADATKAAAAHHPVDSMAVEVDSDNIAAEDGGWDSPSGWPGPEGPDSEPPPAAIGADAGEPYGQGYGQGPAADAAAGAPRAANHAGVVLLCQVPDLLLSDSDTGGDVTFPVSVDVYGLFHLLEGSTAVIEDGSDIVEAQLTDSALAPLLAEAGPPPGFASGAPIGLADVIAMADSLDPAVQAYGQDLAQRIMDFVRDFSGLIRLEYLEPLPAQPLIVQLTNDEGGEAGGGGLGSSATARSVARSGCGLYEQYLHDLGVRGIGAAEEGAKPEDWPGE